MTSRTNRYVLDLDQIDRNHIALTGGKAAQLGELSRLDDLRVLPHAEVIVIAPDKDILIAGMVARIRELAGITLQLREFTVIPCGFQLIELLREERFVIHATCIPFI